MNIWPLDGDSYGGRTLSALCFHRVMNIWPLDGDSYGGRTLSALCFHRVMNIWPLDGDSYGGRTLSALCFTCIHCVSSGLNSQGTLLTTSLLMCT